jgi:CopG family transcriptional regulator, nickel-responsive regulator
LKPTNREDHNHRKNRATRISMSLAPKLLKQFDKSMLQAGFSDRSKAIQAALHAFVDENEWKGAENQSGAGAVFMLYDNHTYNQDRESIHAQHEYADIISASTHVHLDHHNCLETIMVKGQVKKIRELVKVLSQNRGIKSLKLHFVTLV